jgi:hypothetical protein
LTTEEEVMLRRKTRWFRRLAAGLAFATLAAPAAAKNDEGGAQAGAGRQVIAYLSHGMTAADANYGNYEAMTHRQLEELANARAIGNGDALTHRQIEELSAKADLANARAIGNGDALTHRQMEELSAMEANTFVQGVTDFPKAVEVQAPKVINYLSQGLTAADAVDPRSGIPLSAGIPHPGDPLVKTDNLGTFGDAPEQVSPAILGELVKSKPQAVVRPDDRADRFAHSNVQAPATVSDNGSGITWDGALTVGFGAIVAALALALGFGLVRRPKIAV